MAKDRFFLFPGTLSHPCPGQVGREVGVLTVKLESGNSSGRKRVLETTDVAAFDGDHLFFR